MKKIVHHVEISHTSENISGGETSLLGIVRHLNKYENISQIIHTSDSGKEVYLKILGKDAEKIEFVVIGSKKLEKIHEYVAYYLRVLQVFFKVKKFSDTQDNIILSHEEFLPTLIFSLLLLKKNKNSKWFAIFHMRSPSIWRGFEGEYTGKFKFPSLRIIRYRFEQWLFFLLSRNKIDTLITVNPSYEDFLKKIYKKVYVFKIFGGQDIPEGNKKIEKEYDLCFMGRFHEQKGLFEVIDIMKRLKEKKPDISLALLGGGVERVEKRFFNLIKENNLDDNIKYFGYVTGDKKFDILRSCKIFLFPSYYESFGQVALEALRCGLPVVAYDLPPFVVFTGGMVKVPVLDNKKMAEEIVKILDNKTYYEKLRKEGFEFCSNYSWDKTGEEVYKLLFN